MHGPQEHIPPSRVTVMSATEQGAGLPPSRRRLGFAFIGVGLAAVLVFVAGPQVSRTLDEPEPSGVFLVVPDLVGMEITSAEEALRSAGFTRRTVRIWVPNDLAAAGVVTAQSPEQGLAVDAPIELTVSAGGPTISFGALPGSIRAIASGSRIDAGEPVLVIDTSAGYAYLGGGLLFGQCAATDAAETDLVVKEVRCAEAVSVAIVGWLPDGTKFELAGLPTADYLPQAVTGSIMVDLPDGRSQSLGTVTSRRMSAVSGGPPVSWSGDVTLDIVAGDIEVSIQVDPETIDAMGADGRAAISAAVHPSAVDGFPVISLDPPLRWQRVDEDSSTVGVEFSDFTVHRECPEGCDVAESIGVYDLAPFIDADQLVLTMLVDPVEFSANAWVQAFELTFPDGGRWLLRWETQIGMEVAGVTMSGRLQVDGNWVADSYLTGAPVFPLDEKWDPAGALPERLEVHERLDGGLAETWWLSPGSCCAYLTFVNAPDGRVMQWAASALIEERSSLVDSVVWAPDRVSFDSTRFSILGLTFAIEMVAKDSAQKVTVFVKTPCSRGLLGQAPCTRINGIEFNANGLPISDVRVRSLDS